MTAEALRRRILDVTFANGGHLASSLGAVEIALALSQVFDPARDRIVWDVGHQSYAWKILTGRDDRFDTLRVDTHADNRVMQRTLIRMGFVYTGIIFCHNGTPRLAYQLDRR